MHKPDAQPACFTGKLSAPLVLNSALPSQPTSFVINVCKVATSIVTLPPCCFICHLPALPSSWRLPMLRWPKLVSPHLIMYVMN